MVKEFAIIKVTGNKPEYIYTSPMFNSDDITEKTALQDGIQIWFSGDDTLAEEKEVLKKQLEEMERENQLKESFLSNMSHDIRTPMNAIIGMTAIAQKYIDEKSRVQDALDKIEIASSHLLSLVNEVLDISKLNSGTLNIREDLFSLSDLIYETCTIVKPQAEQKNHEFKLEIGDIPFEGLYGDALHLRQIFVNIINNSIKYTNEGGLIEVSFHEYLEEDKILLEFVCKDNGMGMTQEFINRIFTPFSRASTVTQSQIEGTGLGMSIVKKLVDNMDGTIAIESKVNEGTTIAICIPMYYEKLQVNSDAIEGRRLLLIDDNDRSRSTFRKYLDEFNVDCSFVNTYSEAITALSEASFSSNDFDMIVIADVQEDSGNMFDFAGYVRKMDNNVPIVLVSDIDWSNIEYRATRSGINGFIPQPFLRKSLINSLNNFMLKNSSNENMTGTPDLAGKNILLVEDNMINRMIAMELLASTNAKVEQAENGKEAVDMFSASEVGYYDIILMDIQMPVMDGYTACHLIRAEEREDAAKVKIYAMTANIFAEDIAKAKEAGMDGHIAKPIDVKKLMAVLRQV